MKRAVFISLAIASEVLAQGLGQPQPASSELTLYRLPGSLQEAIRKLDGRLQQPEKTRLVITGLLKDGQGERPVVLTWQSPGLFRLEDTVGVRRVVTFDGERTAVSLGSVGNAEQRILESLYSDLPDSIFAAMTGGTGVRYLGGLFRGRDHGGRQGERGN